ncbi:histidine phosphatase family protein [Cytobacillus praedii]|uniref:histidine phosphatase family protein n=1 Tax=Cytobacillus praedii TaxID=1742358 RepID=UPI002E1CD4B8|nr:histidine phosphatase family protein [Cytobacillus praedii]
MDDTVAISLFRHGLTEANKRHAYLGWTDSPLCPIEKAKLVCPSEQYELMFSSDLDRCLKTADILFPTCQPIQLSELREMHFGEWEGKTYADLKGDSFYQKWLDAPFTVKPPKGESFAEFSRRVESGWEKVVERIMEENTHRAAVMTHGGVIRYFLTKHAPYVKDFWEWHIPHGKGYELIWKRDGLRRGKQCILLQEVPLTASPNG